MPGNIAQRDEYMNCMKVINITPYYLDIFIAHQKFSK